MTKVFVFVTSILLVITASILFYWLYYETYRELDITSELNNTTLCSIAVSEAHKPGWLTHQTESWSIQYPANMAVKAGRTAHLWHLSGVSSPIIAINDTPVQERPEAVELARAQPALAKTDPQDSILNGLLSPVRQDQRAEIDLICADKVTIEGNEALRFAFHDTGSDEITMTTTFAINDSLVDVKLILEANKKDEGIIAQYDSIVSTFQTIK